MFSVPPLPCSGRAVSMSVVQRYCAKFKGCKFYRGLKCGLLHWLCLWALTQCSATALPVILCKRPGFSFLWMKIRLYSDSANLRQGVWPQPKVIWDSNPDFRINPDLDPDVCWIASYGNVRLKMYGTGPVAPRDVPIMPNMLHFVAIFVHSHFPTFHNLPLFSRSLLFRSPALPLQIAPIRSRLRLTSYIK